MNKVVFVGAGPGDPELITLKGYRALEEADRVIYTGSLINKDLLNYCREGCETYDSKGLTLDEIIQLMVEAVQADQKVVRLQTGDFSIYGSIREQVEALKERGIDYECIPGVSSFLGAASELGVEYTVPGVSQTVIITRRSGRTPVPEKENLPALASHQASMVIFLSVQMMEDVVKELEEGGYPATTPAVVIYKATWPDQQVVSGTLEDIAQKVEEAGIKKTALILVGDFLGEKYHYSHLYSKDFHHGYRP